jgi:hypothetical protein
MRASETERGIRWLSNFSPGDQPTAQLLLDAIEFVGQDELWEALRGVLGKLPSQIPTPITLVPVREVQAGQAYFGADRNATPKLLNARSLPGSEGTISTLLNSVWRLDKQAGPFTAAPSLANMRAARTRSVVLVDDFSGSGDRILKFKYSFHKHPTLRAWRSRQLIDYHAAVYAATLRAAERLARRLGRDRVHIHRVAPTFHSRPWSSAQIIAVEDLCRRYRYGLLYTDPLGHGRSRGLIAFAHTAPNNLPPILWQQHGPSHHGGPWRPFFLGKAIPLDLQSLFGREIGPRPPAVGLAKASSAAAWRSVESQFTPPAWRELLQVLIAVARNPRTDLALADIAGLPLADALATLRLARAAALVTSGGIHLTDNGRAELKHATGLRQPADEVQLKGSTEPYYPRSLRVGR